MGGLIRDAIIATILFLIHPGLAAVFIFLRVVLPFFRHSPEQNLVDVLEYLSPHEWKTREEVADEYNADRKDMPDLSLLFFSAILEAAAERKLVVSRKNRVDSKGSAIVEYRLTSLGIQWRHHKSRSPFDDYNSKRPGF